MSVTKKQVGLKLDRQRKEYLEQERKLLSSNEPAEAKARGRGRKNVR